MAEAQISVRLPLEEAELAEPRKGVFKDPAARLAAEPWNQCYTVGQPLVQHLLVKVALNNQAKGE